ncbi:collagen alpha-1(I) chain [Gorilla gorilla gorilla]|uniref:collagen alpha-1(I) chain n=1 Tax=Gorilla gorilla gorilla TaxID=9595 RepID=UPI00300926C9
MWGVWEGHAGGVERTWGSCGNNTGVAWALLPVSLLWTRLPVCGTQGGALWPSSCSTFPAATSFEVALPEAPPDVSGELQPDFGHSRQCLWGERHPPAGLPPPPAPRRQMGSSKGLQGGVPRPCRWKVAQSGWQEKGPTGLNRQVPIEGPLQRRFKEPSPRVGGLGPAPGGQRRPQAWRAGWSSRRALQGEWEETGKPGRGSAGRRQGCVGQGGLHSLASSWPGWAPSSSLGQLRRRPWEESPCSGPRDLLPSLESLSWPRCRDTLPSLAGGLVSAGRGGNVGQRFQVWPGARGSGRKNTQRGLPGRGLTPQPAAPTPRPAAPNSQPAAPTPGPASPTPQPAAPNPQPAEASPLTARGSNPAAGGSGLRTTGRAPQAAPPAGLCSHRRPLEMARGWCP